MKFELDESQFVTLGITVGYNKSDATYGWNGFEQGAELFYSHVTDETVEETHSVPLTEGLKPIIFLQNIQKTYLGTPYTDCIGEFSFKLSGLDGPPRTAEIGNHQKLQMYPTIIHMIMDQINIDREHVFFKGCCEGLRIIVIAYQDILMILRIISRNELKSILSYMNFVVLISRRRISSVISSKSQNSIIYRTAVIIFMVSVYLIFSTVTLQTILIACRLVTRTAFMSRVSRYIFYLNLDGS